MKTELKEDVKEIKASTQALRSVLKEDMNHIKIDIYETRGDVNELRIRQTEFERRGVGSVDARGSQVCQEKVMDWG